MRSSLALAMATGIVLASALAGCGGTDKASASVPPADSPTATPTPAGPVVLGRGVIKDGVHIDRDGPAAFAVRIVTIPPDGGTGWHTHPGTETSVVTKGEVTLQRAGACDPVVYRAGDGVFIPDGKAHFARNTGTEPAEIVVTYVLDPNVADRAEAQPAC